MNNTIKILVAIAVLGVAGTASAQSSASATGTANATVIAPLSIYAGPNQPGNTAGTELSFGAIVGTSNGGTVTESGGSDQYNPMSLKPGSQTGTISDQTFLVTGQANYTFNITTPASVTVTGQNHSQTLSVATSLLAPATASSNTLSNGGTYYFNVGGTLTVPANATSDIYSGTWQESVAYN